MPTTFQLVETTFPNGEGKTTQEQINGVYDYLFVLLEQLRYTLFNLDESNLNQDALSEFIKNINEPIYAKIEDTDKNVNEISITAKGLDARLSNAEGDITLVVLAVLFCFLLLGSWKWDITQLDTTAKGLQVSVSNLDGAITNIKTDVNGIRATVRTKIDATQAQSIFDQSAQGFTLAVTSGENGTIFKLNYNGAQIASTGSIDLYVDAVNIYGTLTATKLRGGSISIVDDDDNECGTIQTTYASSSDYKLDISSSAMELFAEDGSLFIASGWDRSNKYHASIEVDGNSEEVQIKGDVIPNSDALYNLGSRNFVWDAIYCSTNELNGSDRNIKNSIEALPEKYVRMLELVEPKRYKLNSGTSGRFHTGFIAQEVEDAMRACGINSQEFAGWARATREDGSETYFLRYSEFIPILWAKVREQEERLKRLEESA